MPFTPFHFGPNCLIALGSKRYIDLPVFVLANVFVDFEPLIVMLFNFDYPIHGYCHTFLIGTLVGIIWGMSAYFVKGFFKQLMNIFGLSYSTDMPKMIISSIAGIWVHVLLDAVLYSNIRPLYPLAINPFYKIISYSAVHFFCIICFIFALILYIIHLVPRKNKASRK